MMRRRNQPPTTRRSWTIIRQSDVQTGKMWDYGANTFTRGRMMTRILVFVLLLVMYGTPTSAVSINFDNCLDSNIKDSFPAQLQFVPLIFEAKFDRENPKHNLNVSVYGDVRGIATNEPYPSPDDKEHWSNPNKTQGKIIDVDESNNHVSTLFAKFNVLSYTPYEMPPSRFCESLIDGECPLGPIRPGFNATPDDDPLTLHGFSVAHQLYSSYAFTTISSTLRIKSGDASQTVLACISANITPDIGNHLANLVAFIPLMILILVGAGTAFAAVFSPWGSPDTFRWTSNYGRDADLLRLVTPGFGDCLQYIQFVVLTGGLSLSYPGYYQPVVSQASWSTLMFNSSLVSHGNGSQSLVDGIYSTNGTYGLDRLSQLVGMSATEDLWAGMISWLLVIIVAVSVCTQVGFLVRWAYRHLANVQEEDLRAKNLPFTLGNVIRIVFNYFFLPLVALSMFQFVVAGNAPPSTTALAAVVLVVLIMFTVWVLRLIATVRPRSYLFDDLPTVLLYGPLYNTYSDDAAAFALIPVVLQLIRGIAIGAVQPSGIAQLVLLAICEVILILTLHAFRPFASPTSMNAYHTFFAIVRLLTTLLSIAFVPSLGVTEAPKGWIGYVILLMHAIVLVFGFFLNAVQTIIEVAARLAGAGGESGVGGGAARGGLVKVFGMRQLSRRVPRRDGAGRENGISDAEYLGAAADRKYESNGARARSMSGSSAILLNRHTPSDGRASVGPESVSALGQSQGNRPSSGSGYTPTTPGAASTFSYLPGNGPATTSTRAGLAGLKAGETTDPYYRPPRAKKATVDDHSPGDRSRGSWASGEWLNKRWSQASAEGAINGPEVDGPSLSGRGTPIPAFLASREASELNLNEPRRSNTDYAVREVDFYYGVRGPALSNLPTRRLGTGPADPTGPVASTTGWFKSLFGGKTKEKGKGFEVVRSSRAPPPMHRRRPEEDSTPDEMEGAETSRQLEGVLIDADGIGSGRDVNQDDVSSIDDEDDYMEDPANNNRSSQVSAFAPSLPGIDIGGAIELPSRVGSHASAKPSGNSMKRKKTPNVPRKSSKRLSLTKPIRVDDPNRLSAIRGSPPPSPALSSTQAVAGQQQTRATEPSSSRLPFGAEPLSSGDSKYSGKKGSAASSILPPPSDEGDSYEAGQVHRRTSSILDIHDRPTSVGQVQQHRASDNIHVVTHGPHPGVDYIGSTAEVVNGPSDMGISESGRSPRPT
ncbi:MAG: hypothetical protein M1825_004049 [Sarcosagium campestre]|nr:MAG: hypothetical protein M1825_004049 [Sarcosagium campestre]